MTHFPRYILAPYVPTPEDVVDRMIHLAGVEDTDLVYDLGCGDGRLAIAAALTRGARGRGIDIEPHWIEQSRLNADQAGVSHLVTFEQGDVLALDIAPASVVFLYLVHWSTQLVLSRLLRQCAPGTRFVSHSFGFEAGSATTHSFVDATGQTRTLHLLVAPGDPSA